MKRPLCWLAVILSAIIFLNFQQKPVSVFQNQEQVQLRGIIAEKQYQETSYGSYLQITLKQVKQAMNLNHKDKMTEYIENDSSQTSYQKLKGKYLCRLKGEEIPELKLGQEIVLLGKYKEWEEATNPGQFDIGTWYLSQGIRGQFDSCTLLYQEEKYSVWRETLWKIRQWGNEVFIHRLGEREGALISAMITGEKEGMDENLKSLYQRNGISHILSISGLHFMFLGMGLFGILQKLSFDVKKATVCSSCIMILYCMLTGSSISTCRAAVMFFLMLMAKSIGRSYDTLSALSLAAILFLIANPYSLWNSGFQLSFLAVAGVSLFPPCLQYLFPKAGKLGKALIVSVGAALTTIPILLYHYGTYSWHSIFLNLFIVPFMSFLLAFAILLLGMEMLSLFCPFTAWLCPIVVWGIKLILSYYEFCCHFCEKLPIKNIGAGSPSFGIILFYYFILILIVVFIKKGKTVYWKIALLIVPCILLVRVPHGLRITMLDVGQGDSIVIENANGNVYLSDCGSSSVSQVGTYRLIPFLKYMGYQKIQGIFVSHLDNDHINGIQELLESAEKEDITIEYMFLPLVVKYIETQQKNLESLVEQAKQIGVEVVFLTQGNSIYDEKLEFQCLYPTEQNFYGDSSNNASLVLSMNYGEFNMLLTGDIEQEGEEVLVERIPKGVTYEVLKVAHHGSKGSSTQELLNIIQPKYALISAGKNNSYGHPHKETIERLEAVGSKTISTAEEGAIRIEVDRGQFIIKK